MYNMPEAPKTTHVTIDNSGNLDYIDCEGLDCPTCNPL